MGSRTWVKLWCDEWLTGSISDEPIESRGVWAGLIALAGSLQFGDQGEIKLWSGVGLEDSQIAKCLKINRQIWVACRLRWVKSGRILVDSSGVITIPSWQKHQSEYERQKPYRRGEDCNQKLQGGVTGKVTGEKEIEKEIEKIPPIVPQKGESSGLEQECLDSLQGDYPELDVRDEWARCQLWWSEGKRQMKRPMSALTNWLRIERQKRQKGGAHGQSQRPAGNRGTGAFDDLKGLL